MDSVVARAKLWRSGLRIRSRWAKGVLRCSCVAVLLLPACGGRAVGIAQGDSGTAGARQDPEVPVTDTNTSGRSGGGGDGGATTGGFTPPAMGGSVSSGVGGSVAMEDPAEEPPPDDLPADEPDYPTDVPAEPGTDLDFPSDADDPLWRETYTSLCAVSQTAPEAVATSVWSDANAVYVMAAAIGANLTAYRNPGDGWVVWGTWPRTTTERRISGIPDHSVLDFGRETCGIYELTNDTEACVSASTQVLGLHVVNEQLAYAAERDRITFFDGTFWKQWGEPPVLSEDGVLNRVWASESKVIAIATSGEVLEFTDGSEPTVFELPSGATAVWGHAPSDSWVSNSSGELWHGDGSTYDLTWKVPDDDTCDGIRGMWGAPDGQLFVHTKSTLWRIDRDDVEQLADFGCDGTTEITGLWGNTASEVFASLLRVDADDCGSAGIAWFDGGSLRAL